MSVYRCKMCGGDLAIKPDTTVCECEFCGSKQTIPTVTDEGLQNLFNRANLLRMKSEFDKASEIYEKILQQSATEAEAYWGLILCKYGIEYVEDPATNKRIPTCHRASYDAVTADEDYKNALKYSDTVQREIYEEQAREIDQLQRGILDIVHKEKPYDVFICYKETDETGKRTPDSVIANDIYHQLTSEGFKVFYAAITLEDKLGTEYEPYIFSALNTAKVMLAIGTKPEYFNAVWVKNEWSRFLKIMKNDHTRLLIPCYRDMDPYELPEEFAHLQAQDMSKIGFINDIVRGIKKVIERNSDQPKLQDNTVVQSVTSGTTVNAQVKRGAMALEDHDWNKADEFFEEALNLDPECAEAYLGKMLARDKQATFISWLEMQKEKYCVADSERLTACSEDSEHIKRTIGRYVTQGYLDAETVSREYTFNRDYSSSLSSRRSQKEKQQEELSSDRQLMRARQYAKGDIKQQIEDGLTEVYRVLEDRIVNAENEDAENINNIKAAYAEYIARTDKKIERMNEEAEERKEQQYQSLISSMKESKNINEFENIYDSLKSLNGYKDSNELASKCVEEIDRLKKEKQKEDERQAVEQSHMAKQRVKKQIFLMGLLVVVAIILITVVIPRLRYYKAKRLLNSGEYEAAYTLLEKIGDNDKIKANKYDRAVALIDSGDYNDAYVLLEEIGDDNTIKANKYDRAIKLIDSGDYEAAYVLLEQIGDDNTIKVNKYDRAVKLINSGDYEEAYILLKDLDYQDSTERLKSLIPRIKTSLLSRAKVGSYIYLGLYEQDNDTSNGKEDIEWLVLNVEDNQALIISKYMLDILPFNEKYEDIYWKNSSIRKWLNVSFLDTAFDNEEQERILTMDKELQDKVFLLSISEVKEYFHSDNERICTGTAYYNEQKNNTTSEEDWWLRTHDIYCSASVVNSNGTIDHWPVDFTCAIRPALWITLN
ncbi:DUF6273 domain-containing protein [Oribacterium sp. FC2011]|uniref:DUF6273 domain-containing protein n=1 Tax=Oribacterium sp. FC2011 TaxID=1408311 RepID=UPI0004E1847B|nr:DUF6273 domain-containing protein [Oribacterium sp. FC2011]